jgi:hypothetical protein
MVKMKDQFYMSLHAVDIVILPSYICFFLQVRHVDDDRKWGHAQWNYGHWRVRSELGQTAGEVMDSKNNVLVLEVACQ